jgi:hypothetical protein
LPLDPAPYRLFPVTRPTLNRRAASSSAYLISLSRGSRRALLTLISIGLSFLTAFVGFASGCLEGDVARAGITGPLPEGFMVRCAEGVENEDESLGPAP